MSELLDVKKALEKAGLALEAVPYPSFFGTKNSYRFTTKKGKAWIVWETYGKIYVGVKHTQQQVNAGAVQFAEIASFYEPQDAVDFILIK